MGTGKVYLYPTHDTWLSWKAHKAVRTSMVFSDISFSLKADTKGKG